jgi:hypothetical protein
MPRVMERGKQIRRQDGSCKEKRTGIWRVAILLAVIATALTVASASHSATTQGTIPFDFATDACGDPVVLAGELHFLGTTVVNASGTFVSVNQFNAQHISGTGLSGAHYEFVGANRSTFVVLPEGTRTFTWVVDFNIIGGGTGPDTSAMTVLHFTVNANGDLTADVDHLNVIGCPSA